MAVGAAAEQHALQQKALARRAAQFLAGLWQRVDPAAVAASWRLLLPEALTVVMTAQAAAAAGADPYLAEIVDAYAIAAPAMGRVAPTAFSLTASDGRPLASLLYQPAITTLQQIGAGQTPSRSLASGAAVLDMIGRTQVADAGRTADAVAMVARPGLSGYVRVLSQPSCARCIILAGKRYRWNAGFRRHPRCDCRHLPVAGFVPDDVRVRPKAYFDSLSTAEQNKVFGQAGAEAIREGADIFQVVNARRGMQTASVFGRDVLVATEGTTSRSLAGIRLGARLTETKRAEDRYRRATRVRLMPEQIFRDARDRDHAIRLLRLHRYII